MQTAPSLTALGKCPELGMECAVGAIDQELRLLWQQDDARTNASLMNLVVYSEKPGALQENSAIVRDLTREHACRAILVEIDRRERLAGIRAWVTAHCHLAHGQKTVCCEQIAFYLTGVVTGRFRNTVFAHLNSDLPLVFWWRGELSDILTERLVAVIDRLIVDSACWANPAASFDRIAKAARSNSDLVLQDHEWTRSWQFRVGLAGIFEDAAAQQMLPDIESVQIVHHPAHRNCALQLLAWLAEQAGWTDAGDGALAFRSRHGRPIRVDCMEDAAAPPVSSLVLRAGESCASVQQAAGATHVERSFESPGYRISSFGPADPASPGELVGLQLARAGRNTLFHKILPRFKKLLAR
ncbi:MAG: glucose-6-phosphate dehydrogenase assembly protein OpcA [Luteolibacter sp.]